MTTNTNKLFQLAQLAEAAYANLILGANLIQELQKSGMKFSDTQATEFAANWQVVSHQPDTASGYSGTLFKYIGNDPNSGFANGELVFAQRGTAGLDDLVIADIHEITANGLAYSQIIDMYNYWQRLTAASGTTVREARLVLANASTPNNQIIVESGLLTRLTIVFEDVANAGLGLANISNLADTTGHSLGGHLADAFTRLFGVDSTSINGAGFPTGLIPGTGLTAGNNIPNLFSMLGGFAIFPTNSIDNIYGDKMPQIVTMNSILGLQQQGSTNPLFIEQPTFWGNVLGHGKEQMTDSLAVANLFIRLDASFATQTPAQALSTLNALFEKGSNQAETSLEEIVASLTQYIFGSNKPTIATDDREALYAAIKTLNDGIDALNLTGKFTLTAPPSSASEARTELGAFLSLYYLTPFALKPNDAGATDTLYQLHATIADKWNADRNLTAEQIQNGEANFSDLYLADRAAMLTWINKANKDDVETPDGLNTVFIDHETNISLGINVASITVPKYIFGNADAENIAGGDKVDHLYGGAGDDTLSGDDGNDWLEGGTDNDTLMGDKGNDVLLGGTGNDILNGGNGNDQLKGGAGNDEYIHNDGDGNDVITDTDGDGSIKSNGTKLAGGDKVAGAEYTWESADHLTRYTQYDQGDGKFTLNILLANGEKIFVKDWVNEQLGIKLANSTPAEPPPVLTSTSDMYFASDADEQVDGGAGNDVLFVKTSAKNITLKGGSGDDLILGYGVSYPTYLGFVESVDLADGYVTINDLTTPLPSNDHASKNWPTLNGEWLFDTRSSADKLSFTYQGIADTFEVGPYETSFWTLTGTDPTYGDVGSGRFWTFAYSADPINEITNLLQGDAGNDLIGGSMNADYIDGGDDDDILYGNTGNDFMFGGQGKDTVFGGDGYDVMDGGTEDDAMAGGYGDDVLQGGVGNDLLLGDIPRLAGTDAPPESVDFSQMGNDYLDGGIGNDSMYGGGKDDTLLGGDGNDLLQGDGVGTPDEYQGSDSLFGGKGADTLSGSAGNDYLDGGDGDDKVGGGKGDDYLLGGAGNDIVKGADEDNQNETGNDTLDGGIGDDNLSGNAGNDSLLGGIGNDTLFGDEGNDILDGGAGNDYMNGGAGNDTYRISSLIGHDSIVDSAGNDTLIIGAAWSTVTVGLTGSTLGLFYGSDLSNYVAIGSGTAGAIDSFEFSGKTLSIIEVLKSINPEDYDETTGGAGDVTMGTGGGLASLSNTATAAETGNNTTYQIQNSILATVSDAGGSADVVDMGISVTSSQASYTRLANDDLLITLNTGAEITIKQHYAAGNTHRIESIQFADLAIDTSILDNLNTTVAQSSHGNDILLGTAGEDVINGLAGNDSIRGLAGNDNLLGGSGHDQVIGGEGDDHIDGGTGDDALFGEAGSDIINGGDGADKLVGDDVTTNGAADLLNGGNGDDQLWGQEGDDTLNGEAGNDALKGGDGNDSLNGGAGDDYLYGNAGNDSYVLNVGDGHDYIEDAEGVNSIVFGTGVGLSDINVTFPNLANNAPANSRMLVIYYGSGDSVTIPVSTTSTMSFQFANGQTLSYAQLKANYPNPIYTSANSNIYGTQNNDYLNAPTTGGIIHAGAGQDYLFGNSGNDQLHGDTGNDTLYGNSGNDALVGGLGNDGLNGGNGSDTYVFKRGDGQDNINEYTEAGSGNINTLQLGSDINASDVNFTHMSSGALLIRINGSADSITINNWFNNTANQLQTIQYGDGSTQDLNTINSLSILDITASNQAGNSVLTGDNYNNRLVGGVGNDTLDGGLGSDTLMGGAGGDTYVLGWTRGDNTIGVPAIDPDTVIEANNEENNIIALPLGLDFTGLVFQQRGNDLYVGVQGSRNIDYFNLQENSHNAYEEFTPDGMLIKDYYSAPQNWQLISSTGIVRALTDVMQEASLPPVDLIQSAYDDWVAGQRQSIMADAILAVNYGTGKQLDNNHFEIIDDYGRLVSGLDFAETYSNEATIYRMSDYSHYSYEVTGSYSTVVSGNSYYAPKPVFEGTYAIPLYDYGLLDTEGNPTFIGFLEGNYGSSNLNNLNTYTVTVTTANTYDALVLDKLQAGDSDNFIDVAQSGIMAVFAGAGNDIIAARGWSGQGPIGDFLNGEEGNDSIFGTYQDDIILAGSGNDFMSGNDGDDTYLINPNDTGIKLIDEVFERINANGIGYVGSGGGRYSTDTVEFGTGLSVNDIRVSRGLITPELDVPGFVIDPSKTYNTLEITWGDALQTLRIVLPDPNDVYAYYHYNGGYGVEYYKFADGTILTAAQMEALAVTLPTNHAPEVLASIAAQTTLEDSAFNFTVSTNAFADVDVGDILSYAITLVNGNPLPSWLSYNATTHTISGTPTNGEVGSLSLTVTATDVAGATASQNFDVTVTNTNDAPTVLIAIAAQTATEDAAFSYVIPTSAFADVDTGDTLTYNVALANGDSLPSWLTFNAATSTLSGTPTNSEVGSLSLTVTATDVAGATASQNFDLTVQNTNDTPTVLIAIAAQTATEDAAFSYVIPTSAFADVDTGDTLTYNVTLANGDSLPSWLTFNAATSTLSGISLNADVGNISFKVTATDTAGATASQNFDLTVQNTNDAPTVLIAIAAQTTLEDGLFNFTIPADAFSDVDAGDVLTYTSTLADGSILPSWLTFDAETRTFTGTPTNSEVGSLSLTVTATDVAGASASQNFDLSVQNSNDAPTLNASLMDTSINELQAITYSIPANTFADVDVEDTLAYTATLANGAALPSWLTFNSATRTLTGTPLSTNTGILDILVKATDSAGAFSQDNFLLTVKPLNRVLTGTTSNDSLVGGAGYDTINGGAGSDTMVGGLGNDTYTIDVLADVITENLNEGIDLVNVAMEKKNGSYTLAANIENATLTNTVAYDLVGNAENNVLVGNAEKNILTGAAGTDVLTGGLGADRFDFNAILESLVGTSRDIITDFSRVQKDKIDLSTIDADSLLANDQAFLSSILTSGAFTSIGQLRLVGDILSGNTDSNFATSEFEIQLTGVTTLAANDFVL